MGKRGNKRVSTSACPPHARLLTCSSSEAVEQGVKEAVEEAVNAPSGPITPRFPSEIPFTRSSTMSWVLYKMTSGMISGIPYGKNYQIASASQAPEGSYALSQANRLKYVLTHLPGTLFPFDNGSRITMFPKYQRSSTRGEK